MTNELSGMNSQTVAVVFCGFYLLTWIYVTNKWLWILISSAASVMFLRFVLQMPLAEQATLPPVSMVIAAFHWPIVYLCFSNPR